MKNFLNPTKNAKTIAFIFFILFFIEMLDVFSGSITQMGVINAICYLIVGIGLRKTKKWGIYALGILVLTQLHSLYLISQFPEYQSTYLKNFVINSVLLGVPFVWFYKQLDKFE